MKRSEVNYLVRQAKACFYAHGWTLPADSRWDVTDFGLGDWKREGLVLVNLAEEAEYCEKIMYARDFMKTPAHCHQRKKEDIICRWGEMIVQVWADASLGGGEPVRVKISGKVEQVSSGSRIRLSAGERVTLEPKLYHAFWPESPECIIGEVSTANDDLYDNFFVNRAVGRFAFIEEDEPSEVVLVRE